MNINSSLDNSTDELEKQKLKIEKLEQQLAELQTNKKHEIPNCIICKDTIELPVTLNVMKYGKHVSKCPSSQGNQSCLMCVRQCMTVYSRQNKNWGKKQFKFPCPTGCCELEGNGWKTYGEIGRTADDVAEPTLWRNLGKNGETTCRRCGKEQDSVYELGKHVKLYCEKRKIWCHICKKVHQMEQDEEHKNECFSFCKWCGVNVKIETDNKLNVLTSHICANKPIARCLICNENYSKTTEYLHRNCLIQPIKKHDVSFKKFSQTELKYTKDEGFTYIR
jgi:hypothetical protein